MRFGLKPFVAGLGLSVVALAGCGSESDGALASFLTSGPNLTLSELRGIFDIETSEDGIIQSARYGDVEVNFTPHFPITWTNSAYSDHDVGFSVMGAESRVGFLSGLEREISRHPKSFLEEQLDTVYPLDLLSMNGHPWGGTRAIDIATGEKAIYLTDPRIFAHEFSSMWLLNPSTENLFPLEEWFAISPRGQYIGYDRTSPLPPPEWIYGDSDLLQNGGFLSLYGTWLSGSGFPEEDLNLYAGGLFTDPARLFYFADRNPDVASKVRLTMGYYSTITGQDLDRDDFLEIVH